MDQEARPVEPSIGQLCYTVHQAMETEVFAAVVAAGFDDITLAQARLVARIEPAGTRLTALADQARVTKQTAGFLVDQLERAGYVQRVPDPADARARLVRVAPRGWAALDVAATTTRRIEADWAARLGSGDVDQLRRILNRLREVVDPRR